MNEYCIYTQALVFTPACACPMSVVILCLFSYHLPDTLDPLAESLVTCHRLTSLELIGVTLSLQSLVALVKGLHNLRTLGLKMVYLLINVVSD